MDMQGENSESIPEGKPKSTIIFRDHFTNEIRDVKQLRSCEEEHKPHDDEEVLY